MPTPLAASDYLRQHIRTVPDWPAPGVQFRDITPLLQDPRVFRVLIDVFVHRYMTPELRPDVVAGLDARGFIIGSVVAYELGVGFVPIRKKGKLPYTTVAETFELEYGSATVELHTDAIQPGQRVLLIDADVRRSSIARYFALQGSRGLSDILRDNLGPSALTVPIDDSTLSVLPAGSAVDNPGEMFTAARLEPIFQWARANFDVVMVNVPAILPASDAVVLGRFADVTAFVVRHGQSTRADVADAVRQYRLGAGCVSGFVFNCFAPSSMRARYRARYGYCRL